MHPDIVRIDHYLDCNTWFGVKCYPRNQHKQQMKSRTKMKTERTDTTQR